MKNAAQSDFTRTLPSLLITAMLSAGSVIALAVIHSLLVSEVSQPPKKVASASKSPPATFSEKSKPASLSRKEVPATKIPAVANPESKKPPAEIPVNATASAKPETANTELAKTPAVNALQDSRADYERERKEFFAAVDADLTRQESAAKDAGDAELINKAKAARDAFAQGIVPKDAPGKELIELMFAREKLATALQRELQTARDISEQSQVASLQKEFFDFMQQESADIGDINWRFPECTFRLINVATGLALAAQDEGNGAAVIQAKENPTDPLQHWFVRFPGQWYSRVRLRKNGRNLNVPASDRATGREIIMWHEEHQHNGYWELQYRGNYYHVRSLFSGKLLSVPEAKKQEGLQLIQWDHHNGDDQKWQLIRVLPATDEPPISP